MVCINTPVRLTATFEYTCYAMHYPGRLIDTTCIMYCYEAYVINEALYSTLVGLITLVFQKPNYMTVGNSLKWTNASKHLKKSNAACF